MADSEQWGSAFATFGPRKVVFHTSSFSTAGPEGRHERRVALWSNVAAFAHLHESYESGEVKLNGAAGLLPASVCKHWSYIMEDPAVSRGYLHPAICDVRQRDLQNRSSSKFLVASHPELGMLAPGSREPLAYLHEARQLVHPAERAASISAGLQEAIGKHLSD